MSETTPGQSDPFQRLQPQDFEPPNWAELPAHIIEQLTAEGGPGVVTDPATQHELPSAQALIPDYEDGTPGHSGITHYFAPGAQSGNGIPDIVRALPVFQRFQILYPDLVTALMHRMSGVSRNAPRELHEPLFAAYRIMRHLVDRRDPHIVDADGTVDDIFLTR